MARTICYLVVFFSEALISWLYFEHLFERKRANGVIALTFILGAVTSFGIYTLSIAVMNTVAFFVANLFLLYFNYYCRIKTAILHTAFLSFIMAVSEILVALLLGLFGYEFAAYSYNFGVMLALVIMSKLLYLAISMISVRLFAPHKRDIEEPQMMLFFVALPIFSSLIADLVIYLGLQEELSDAAEIIIIVTFMALFAVNLIFFVLYNHMQKASAEYLALQLSIQKDEADAEYYKAIQEQSESQRILIHDIRKHLRIIDNFAKEEENSAITDYIEQLESALGLSRQARLCSDPIVNTILIRAAQQCREKEIDLHIDVRENCTAFMDAPSKTAIYGNLLSNAIEAAELSEEKMVELSVVRDTEQGSTVVSIINSCDSAPVRDSNGLFLTRKQNSKIHGIGQRSIERIVSRYHGIAAMYYDAENRKFHCVIRFPEQETAPAPNGWI